MRLFPLALALLACNPPVDANDDVSDGGDTETPAEFAFTIPAWTDGGAIPTEYTCDGTGGWTAQPNPELVWENPPEGTAAFAVIYIDTSLGDWEHWAFYTADATVLTIPANTSNTASLPAGVTELTSQDGRTGYVPNCPGGSSHTYEFTIYAVSDASVLQGQTTFSGLESAAQGALLDFKTYSGVSDAG